MPKRETVEGWVEQVPSDFLFAIKSSRYLTHMKRLRKIADGVARFWEPLEPLRRSHRLGPVFWQLPGSGALVDRVAWSPIFALIIAVPVLILFSCLHRVSRRATKKSSG